MTSPVQGAAAAPAPRKAPRAPMLQNLHKLRGLAAIAVVISHLTHWYQTVVPSRLEEMLCNSGVYAVGVFFVISGFIIARSHRAEMGSIRCIGSYVIKRFFRIYPAYWAYSAVFIVLGALGYQCWDVGNLIARTPAQMIAAIFLIPVTGAPHGFLAVSWSLYYEILFYSVFAFFFVNRRLGFAALGLLVIAGYARHSDPITSPYCINRITILFLAGVIIGLCAERLKRTYIPPIAITLAGVLSYACAIYRIVPMNSHYPYAAAVLLVLGAVAADVQQRQERAATPLGKSLMWLGTISYSLYLCHVPVQAVLYRVLGSPYHAPVVATLFVTVPVLIASGGYLLIEKPSQNLARLLLSRAKTNAARQPPEGRPSPTGAPQPAGALQPVV